MVAPECLNVGDKVVVSTTASFNGSKKAVWAGKVMTIRSIDISPYSGRHEIRMVEDAGEGSGNGWAWRVHQLDYYNPADTIIPTKDKIDVGVEVILIKNLYGINRKSYGGRTVTISAISEDKEDFLIEEDGRDYIYHFSEIASIARTLEATIDQSALTNFLESMVGTVV